jgi:hypothetical protein
MFCPMFATQRPQLFQNAGTRNYKQMLATARGAKAAAGFVQQTGLLQQFQLGLK